MACVKALAVAALLVGCATSADSGEISGKPTGTITAEAKAAPPADAGPSDHAAAATATGSSHGAGAAATPPADPFGDVGFKEVTEKAWLAGIRAKVSQRQKIDPSEIRFSAGRLRAAFVRSPPPTAPPKPGRRTPSRRHEIVVVDNQGAEVATFRSITAAHSDEPPRELRFLSEDRLVYEVVAAPPPDPSAANKAATKAVTAVRKAHPGGRPAPRSVARTANHEPARTAALEKPAPPKRLFIIQPIAAQARPIRCEGVHFGFTLQNDRLSFVGGHAESAFVAVDGAQVYPRRGRTIVSSAPVWSKDGRSLAFLESPPGKTTRLVMLAEFDNPTGDTTWELPAATSVEGTRVFWAGSGKLVVGKSALRPVFSASFAK